MTVNSLDSTSGVRLVVFFFGTILYGVGLLQCWLYFRWYPRDSLRVKSAVLLLLFFETLQISMFLVTTYIHLISHFGDFHAVMLITWADLTHLMGVYISALIVQLYFAHSLYSFDKQKNIYCSLLIVSLAAVAFGAGIGQVITAPEVGTYTSLGRTKFTACTQSVATLSCDLVITVSLCLVFNIRKTGMKSTDSMLNTLIIYAIGRGVLTAITATVNFILFLALPGTLYFIVGLVLSSKLYMNNMLFSLNSRQHIRNQGDHECNSVLLNMPNLIPPQPAEDETSKLRFSAPPASASGQTNTNNNNSEENARFRSLSRPIISS